MRSTSRIPFAIVIGLALAAGTAQAQQPGVGSGWAGYNPGYSWGMAGPAVTVPNAVAAVPAAPVPGTAWTGYAPYTAWTGYAPGTAWRYIDPNAGTRPVIASPAVTTRQYASPIPSGLTSPRFREYGSGRPIPMAKPWLPGSR